MAKDQFAEAEAVYRADLRRHPNNVWSLLGLAQSLREQGAIQEAEALAEKVKAAWQRADVAPVASCCCHPDTKDARRSSASR